MQRRSGLGRGLGSLIPSETEVDEGNLLVDLPIHEIEPNRFQPRQHFDEDGLEDLAASIRELGVLQPILVRTSEAGYELIAGERRWRAARRAGLASIPALVRTVENQAALEHAVVENLHRQDLNPLEEAAAYQQLLDDFGLTQEQVAQRVGKSRSAVANTLRLLSLEPGIQRHLIEGSLSAGHARALLAIEDPHRREELAGEIITEGWSVRETEELVRRASSRAVSVGPPAGAPSGPGRAPGAVKDAALLELEELLSDHLQTRVTLTLGKRTGRVVIDFADLDDLERIYRRMLGPDAPG